MTVSRSGYTDDFDNQWSLICWRGAVAAGIRGKRGQAFLRELAAVLDAMPEKRLIAQELATADGQVCALGSVAVARGLDVSKIDVTDYYQVSRELNIPRSLAQEIIFFNDDDWRQYDIDSDEKRWQVIRNWINENLIEWDEPAKS